MAKPEALLKQLAEPFQAVFTVAVVKAIVFIAITIATVMAWLLTDWPKALLARPLFSALQALILWAFILSKPALLLIRLALLLFKLAFVPSKPASPHPIAHQTPPHALAQSNLLDALLPCLSLRTRVAVPV